MSIDMYLPAFPSIAKDFQVLPSSVQATLASFTIGMGIGQLVYGPLADQFGRKKNLLFGMTLYALASALCALAPSIHGMTALRFVQGLGGCAGMVMARAIVRDRFSADESAKVFSAMMLVMGVAPILAPSLGGLILEHFHWRFIFWLLSALGVVALVNVLFFLPESLPPSRRVPSALRHSFKTYFRILKDREFVGYALSSGMVSAGMFSYIATSSFVFIKHYHFSEREYAIFFGVNAVGLIAASQFNRLLLKKFTPDQILGAGLNFYLINALLLFILTWTDGFGIYGLVVPLFLAISCVGFSNPNATAGAMRKHGAHAGTASALLGTLMFGSGTMGALLQSALKGETALFMSAQIAVCSVLAWSFFQFFVRRTQKARS